MAALSSATFGDIQNSAVAVGDNNVVVNNSPGAVVNITQVRVRPSARPEPVIVLPQDIDELVGRREALAALGSATESSKKVSLWAGNGMGKTAVIRRFMHSLHEGNGSRSLAYLDARGLHGDDLMLGLYDLFYERPTGFLPSSAAITAELQKTSALVFVDNLDRTLAPEDTQSMLNAAPGCSFVLIAEQRALVEGKSLRLSGLPIDDAVALFEEKFGRSLSESEKQAVTGMCEALQGSPDEIIRVALRGCDEQKTPEQLLAQVQAAGADAASLAQAATDSLTETDRKLVAILAAAGENPVLIPILQAALPGIDVTAQLERLKALGIAQSHSPRYSLCGSLPEGIASAWDLTQWSDQLLELSSAWLAAEKSAALVLDALPMMMHLLSDAARRQKWAEALRLGQRLEPFVFVLTRWEAWRELLDIIRKAAQAVGERAVEAWALHQLGSRALAQGALELARSYLGQALRIRQSIGDQAGLAATQHNLSVLQPAGSQGTQRGQPKPHSAAVPVLTPAQATARETIGRAARSSLPKYLFVILGIVAVGLALGLFSILSGNIVSHLRATTLPSSGAPPVVSTTRAPIIATNTTTATATLTGIPSGTPSLTPTLPSTATPLAAAQPFNAVVLPGQNVFCHYGPGSKYLIEWTLSGGDEVLVQGVDPTAYGPYVYVKYTPKFGTGPALPCWVDPQFLDLQGGDISTLPQPYPDKAPLILFTDPRWVPSRFPPPSDVSASRNGNLVEITWTGVNLANGDREDPGRSIFLLELWTCQAGKLVFTPIGYTVPYDAQQPTVQGYAQVQDDAGCAEPSHGWIYLAHKDGYVGPTYISPWP